jgi:hypothetical protein
MGGAVPGRLPDDMRAQLQKSLKTARLAGICQRKSRLGLSDRLTAYAMNAATPRHRNTGALLPIGRGNKFGRCQYGKYFIAK